MAKYSKMRLFALIVLFAAILYAAGCSADDELNGVPVEPEVINDETANNEEVDTEEPEAVLKEGAVDYYWPWLSHGELLLSSGEIIVTPDILHSEAGFIEEFTTDYGYDGLVVWYLEDRDFFDIKWVELFFAVERYEDNEWIHNIEFEFYIDGFQLLPGETGIQEYALDLKEEKEGFKVAVSKIIFGVEQDSSYRVEPINYIALRIAMSVDDAP